MIISALAQNYELTCNMTAMAVHNEDAMARSFNGDDRQEYLT
jgi:hypothetical protein